MRRAVYQEGKRFRDDHIIRKMLVLILLSEYVASYFSSFVKARSPAKPESQNADVLSLGESDFAKSADTYPVPAGCRGCNEPSLPH